MYKTGGGSNFGLGDNMLLFPEHRIADSYIADPERDGKLFCRVWNSKQIKISSNIFKE
jgi:hypothetical protein